MPNWYDPKRVIVYESAKGPIEIVPEKPETGKVMRVWEEKGEEKTLTLQFPHIDGACSPRSNKVAMVPATVFYGFGAKTGNWHYKEDVPPKDGPIEENMGLRGFTTAELAMEVKRREKGAASPPRPGLDKLKPTAKVETAKPRIAPPPPPPPVDPEVEAKIQEQAAKAAEAAKSDAKFVKIKRKRGKKWITIPRIKPESMKEGDKIIGIVELKESAKPEEPVVSPPEPQPLTAEEKAKIKAGEEI